MVDDEPRPGRAEIEALRHSVVWEQVAFSDLALDRYLAAVSDVFLNGGYLFSRWRAVEYPDALTWFTSRNRRDECDFLRVFFDNGAVREGLAELRIPSPLPDDLGFEHEWPGTLCLDGLLAGMIFDGGAHAEFEGPARDAKALGVGAAEALVQGRYEDFEMDRNNTRWTPWFHNRPHDLTCVLTDTANAEVTVLCTTDYET